MIKHVSSYLFRNVIHKTEKYDYISQYKYICIIVNKPYSCMKCHNECEKIDLEEMIEEQNKKI